MRAPWLTLLGVTLLVAGRLPAQDPGPASNRRDRVFTTEAVTRDRIFGPGRLWHDSIVVVDSVSRAQMQHELGMPELDSTVVVHWTAAADGAPAGYYRVVQETGKYLPFDFLVAMDELLAVREVVVLTYREARGGQVQRERFTRQFQGKTNGSPIRLNRDIVGISGATLSAQAVSRGVKKTLWWAARMFALKAQDP